MWVKTRAKPRRFLLLDDDGPPQECCVLHSHRGRGLPRNCCTSILLFQVLLYLSDYWREYSRSTSKFGLNTLRSLP